MTRAIGQAGVGLVGVALIVVGFSRAAGSPEERIDYNRDIRPIITKCFTCHGPSSGDGMAGLRLDTFAAATAAREGRKRAIVPGKPDESELIRRINAEPGAGIMPPVSAHKTLSDLDKRLMRQWIAEGAEYKEHWAFVKPVRPTLPQVEDKSWPRNGIDRFVLAKLEHNGLKPEPEADRATLIRRVSLDLTGLPPTIDEVQAFVGDRSANAYEKLVDRLLESPRYGERMAMDWMDYSRYADSNGYQADYERFQSRWRDWVIESFNRNMPYDEFTVDQIAGDLLPNPTVEQKLATAFNRNHRINTEGGVIAEEWRVENVIDRVETTSAVWLGLTSGCARCHDHKYDPLTQKDFYRLFSFFNNVPESGTGEERPMSHPPTMAAPTELQLTQSNDLNRKIAVLDASLEGRIKANGRAAADWKLTGTAPSIESGRTAHFILKPDGTAKPVGPMTFGAGRVSGSGHTDEKSYLDLGATGDIERDHAFSFGAWIKPDRAEGSPFSRMDSNSAYRGWELSLVGGRVQTHLINNWPENAVKVATKSMLAPDRWSHVFVTYDGGSKAQGLKIYIDGKEAEKVVERDALSDTIRTGVTTKIGRRTDSEYYSGNVDDFCFYDRELKADEVAQLASVHPAWALLTIPAKDRSADQKREIVRLWSLEHDRAYRTMDDERAGDVAERDRIRAEIPDVMVMAEMPKPRECFVLIRGQYDKHGDQVEAGLPAFLPPMPKSLPNNRLGLAKWIVSADNPLTARVTVNRLWERFFGTGIVPTVEDFGTRAEFPSNPELLDYLATEFVGLRWNLKAMIKEIAMSASYRQSSSVTDAKIEADPENKLISRGPRFRLPGEVIRDQALFVSGLLVEKLGGPSVRPYQPDGIWDELNVYGNLRNYKHDIGPDLYRRSLYTIWKRTAAPPNMTLFDVPPRETCRVHRARTDTPLQALTLLNDVTFVEAARVLAEHAMLEGGPTLESRLTWAFRRVLARDPTAQELSILATGMKNRIEKFRADPLAARMLAMTGDSPTAPGLDRAEIAAYTVAAGTLLNLDETVTKD